MPVTIAITLNCHTSSMESIELFCKCEVWWKTEKKRSWKWGLIPCFPYLTSWLNLTNLISIPSLDSRPNPSIERLYSNSLPADDNMLRRTKINGLHNFRDNTISIEFPNKGDPLLSVCCSSYHYNLVSLCLLNIILYIANKCFIIIVIKNKNRILSKDAYVIIRERISIQL